jgi:aminoglycoside N3'-acetyltransferase
LVHSDVRGFTNAKLSPSNSAAELRTQIIDLAFQDLKDLANGRETILPAFNYDFTSTLKFDVEKDLPQIGRIPVEAMSRKGWRRSHSPVYSFLSDQEQLPTYLHPFSKKSVFSELAERDGEIALVGVGFERLTFIHYVEQLFHVPYRYSKRFTGKVFFGDTCEIVTAEFHVRPLDFGLEYDFEKIGKYLTSASAAEVVSEKLILLSAKRARDCLLETLERDPTYLLDRESAIRVLDKLSLLGRPFELEDFE